jgi:hypothetical protein
MERVRKRIQEIKENIDKIDKDDEKYILEKLSDLFKDLNTILYYTNDLKASIRSERLLLKEKIIG